MTNEDITVNFEKIKNDLHDRRLYVVAKATGVSYVTLKKLADGKTQNYSIRTLKKVADYLKKD